MDVFKLWCWRRLLRVPWTSRRSNQSILEEINPEYSLEGASQVAQWETICLQCRRVGFDPLVRKIPWRRKWQPTPVFLLRQSHGQRSLVGCIQSMGQQRVGYDLATQQQFFGRTDAEAEAPILWPPDTKSQHNGKDPNAGKDWGQVEKGTSEDEIVGWHHRLNGHEFEQTPRDREGQGSLAYCSPWDYKESDTTERLNIKNNFSFPVLATGTNLTKLN